MDEIDLQATEEYLNNSNIIDIQATEEYYREPLRFAEDRKPDFVDTGIIIGAEILGPVLGSAFGPKGIIIGSALGNYASQKYRIRIAAVMHGHRSQKNKRIKMITCTLALNSAKSMRPLPSASK